MTTEEKNSVLAALARLLKENEQRILDANVRDLEECGDLDEAMLDRLKVDSGKIAGMAESVEATIGLDDPEGKIFYEFKHENGMKIENRSVPFGKILIIYESRPDVTIEASVLAFKAGNKILLKGGKEAKHTNKMLVYLWQEALVSNGCEKDRVSYLDLSREETQDLIKNNSHGIDLIIPRGGEGLINFVQQNSSIPMIISGRGNNFLYVDKECDFDLAIKVILNGKSRISVCNALDKVLLHRELEDRGRLIEALNAADIEILEEADESVWGEEFLSAKILLSSVENMDEAIGLINKYSGGHSASIITSNSDTAARFQHEVDCAAVYHNASTRFTDGGQFGFGAEIATSTQKLHFRGPIGLNQLVTNKWFINGNGQVR